MKETIEINVEEYINLRNTVNKLQSENSHLRAVVDSIKVVMSNAGIVKEV